MKEEKLPSLKTRGMALVKPRVTIVVLDAIGNGRLHAIEEEQAAEEDKRDGEGGSEKKQAGSVAVARDCPSEAVNDAGHGIEAIKPAPTLGHKRRGVGDWRGEHPELDEKRDDVPDVTI